MLCCGLLALIAAAVAGSWRRLRVVWRVVLIGGATTLIALPAIALGTAEQVTPLSQAEVMIRAMVCGQPAN